jgi:hypothetical protein
MLAIDFHQSSSAVCLKIAFLTDGGVGRVLHPAVLSSTTQLSCQRWTSMAIWDTIDCRCVYKGRTDNQYKVASKSSRKAYYAYHINCRKALSEQIQFSFFKWLHNRKTPVSLRGRAAYKRGAANRSEPNSGFSPPLLLLGPNSFLYAIPPELTP